MVVDDPAISTAVVRGALLVSLRDPLDDDCIPRLREVVLQEIADVAISGVIIDLSDVPMLDSYEFELLRNTVLAIATMGRRTVISGLRVGVISALVQLDVDTSGVLAVSNLDDGFAELARPPAKKPASARRKGRV